MPQLEIIKAGIHNLKNISLKIPKGAIITITGVSGSGKSSLAYDTLFMEGQKKFLQSLSLYARQFIKSCRNNRVKSIRGLSPTIAIEQKPAGMHYNATVGSLSGIDHYLRILYSNLGEAFCPGCKARMDTYSPLEIQKYITDKFYQQVIYIFASIRKKRRESWSQWLKKYQKKGYQKVLIDEKLYSLDALPVFEKYKNYSLFLQIDAVRVKSQNLSQINESLELANFEGDGKILIRTGDRSYFFGGNLFCPKCRISLPEPRPLTFSTNSRLNSCVTCGGSGIIQEETCPECQGSGLNREALSFGFKGFNIFELGEVELKDLLSFFSRITPEKGKTDIIYHVLPQIIHRLEIFSRLNLGYLNLNRKINTLAGGEIQRTRLVSQSGFELSGIIYILDEPSAGLHPSELRNFVQVLQEFKARNNTVVIVEHDEDIIRSSDYIVELGPGAGGKGGQVMFSDRLARLRENRHSITSDYIYRRKELHMQKEYSTGNFKVIRLIGLKVNNLKNVSVDIPLKGFTVIAGVSGSGKSSLITQGLYPLLKAELKTGKSFRNFPQSGTISGTRQLSRIRLVDQKIPGKHGRSCVATYINLLSPLTRLFSALPQAKMKGFTDKRFNYNHPLGRCQACRGLGEKKIHLKYLPDLIKECEVCAGTGYQSEVLRVEYRGLSIARVLQLTITEASEIFINLPPVVRTLSLLKEMGLGYLLLGQKLNTLSGGESQRLKMCRELVKSVARNTMYLFDEPTVGLHFKDIQKLLNLINAVICRGNTVVVIEHNRDIIRWADHVIELGPAGGTNGGRVVFAGPVKDLVNCKTSVTGKYLRMRLKQCP